VESVRLTDSHEVVPRDTSSRGLPRRALLAGIGLSIIGTAGAEYRSLGGRFDHRRTLSSSRTQRFRESLEELDRGASGILHVAHSTHLVAFGGMRMLTDPWFYDPAFGALSHEVTPAAPPSQLGRLDAILVSHDHADHADLRAMDEMDKRAVVVVATADLAARVRALGFRDVSVLPPWEDRRLGNVVVAAVPALHDVHEIGFVLRSGGTSVYFAGDTALHPEMAAIAERYKPDVALLPVDGTRLSGSSLHAMTPEEAVTAAGLLGAKLVLPSHAEAYFSDPLAGRVLASMVPRARHRFAETIAKTVPAARCSVPEPGQLVPVALSSAPQGAPASPSSASP
jgi:L-ascorbate metabolism protein UlaG (beta-lactamase superfamily)